MNSYQQLVIDAQQGRAPLPKGWEAGWRIEGGVFEHRKVVWSVHIIYIYIYIYIYIHTHNNNDNNNNNNNNNNNKKN